MIIRMLIVFISIVFLCNITTFAATQDSADLSIYYNAPSSDLIKELDDCLAKYKKNYKVTDKTAAEVKRIIQSISLQECGEKADADQDKKQLVWEIGPGILPVIAQLMSDNSNETRYKALLCAGTFIRRHENITKNYDEVESLLILVFRRSLLDKDIKMRMGAVSCLAFIGIERLGNKPEGVKIGLEQAELYDPDPGVRKQAHFHRGRLGLRPREPGDILYY